MGYITVESKNDSDFIVEHEKNRIQLSSKGLTTTGESMAVYGLLTLPRREPTIKVKSVEKVVVVSVR